MTHHRHRQRDVAVVGTGMAGLVTAYLLHHDPQQRFRVQLVEKNTQPSLAAESISISTASSSSSSDVDVPMRAFAGGFYRNLVRMYDYLRVEYHAQPFLFQFSGMGLNPHSKPHDKPQPYMMHASNFHMWPPMPHGDVFGWLVEVAFVLVCYAWFSLCCFFVPPLSSSSSSSSSSPKTKTHGCTETESLSSYLHRIRLPTSYTTRYLLPMLSSVSTCSHDQMLRFPASDVLTYKRLTHSQPHFVVTHGVRTAQKKLLQGLDVRLGVESVRVVPGLHGSSGRGSDGDSESGGHKALLTTRVNGEERTEQFDLAVLAVAPDAAARMFEPVSDALGRIPTTMVTTVAHTDFANISSQGGPEVTPLKRDNTPLNTSTSTSTSTQQIYLRTNGSITEAVHVQPYNSLLVTTNPLTPIDATQTVRAATFTRVLRDPTSQRLINEMFEEKQHSAGPGGWRNGEGGVYMAGGWCWDGMVLLEGCVVSAMRVARDLGVDVPWSK